MKTEINNSYIYILMLIILSISSYLQISSILQTSSILQISSYLHKTKFIFNFIYNRLVHRYICAHVYV